MAIKTNISKAYDRVECEFLESTMKYFCFSTTWIDWVMATVRTLSYSVLINSTPHGLITLERGLRQGDPLSPYLFILSTDVMSHLLQTNTQKGKIRGIKLAMVFQLLLISFLQLTFCSSVKQMNVIVEL